MISIYKEGGERNMGLSIGYCRGVILFFRWVSFKKDTDYQFYLLFRNPVARLFSNKKEKRPVLLVKDIKPFSKSFVNNFNFVNGK
jgi:hypothetical protein